MSRITNRIRSAIHRVLGWLAFSCRDISRLSSQSLDTSLPRFTRFRMSVHFLICKWCRRYRTQIALLRRACARLGSDAQEAGPSLPPEARERIRKHLCGHDGH